MVLTNFIGKGLKSRPLALGGHSEGPGQGEGHRPLTGPVGWSRSRPRPPSRPLHTDHPLRPLQGLRGPLRCRCLLPGHRWASCRCLGSTRYYPPRYPPSIPVPGTIPSPYTPPAHVTSMHLDRSDTHFGTPVGEPRGMRTQP